MALFVMEMSGKYCKGMKKTESDVPWSAIPQRHTAAILARSRYQCRRNLLFSIVVSVHHIKYVMELTTGGIKADAVLLHTERTEAGTDDVPVRGCVI